MASKQSKQHGPFEEIELSVSARAIRDRDIFSTSDPMCVLYTQKVCSGEFVEYGRTESVKDSLSPDFVKKFKLDYFYNERQILKFELYDKDSQSDKLTRHDFLGQVTCSLEDIVKNKIIQRPIECKGLLRGHDGGTMIISVEDVGQCNDIITLQFRAEGLDKVDWFGHADPYLTFYRINLDNSSTIVYRTEIILNTLHPEWQQFTLPLKTLCACDFDRTIHITCWDWNRQTRDVCIGECDVTASQLKQQRMSSTDGFKLVNFQRKEKSSKYDNSGKLVLVKCEMEKKYSFLDYTTSGLRIHFTAALDVSIFSEHEKDAEKALVSLRQSIEYFDQSKIIRTLGFGGRLETARDSEPEVFFLNDSNPCCEGVDGIITSYKRVLNSSIQAWEANILPVIKYVEKFARDHHEDGTYFVLLILVQNYAANDTAKIRDVIKQVSSVPLSIIILGIGSNQFAALREIENENDSSASDDERQGKDILHFVKLQDFMDQSGNVVSGDRLAGEVFKKLPDQCLHWMTCNDIVPRYK